MSARRVAALFVMGGLLGFSLSRMGFTDWDAVHAMFRFEDLRLFLTFAVGVAILTAAFAIVRRTHAPSWPARPITKGTLPGAVVFGVGWALSGACPGVILAQLGEGRFYGLISLAGVLAGNYAYAALMEPSFAPAEPHARAEPSQ